jgi:hypothetical protein
MPIMLQHTVQKYTPHKLKLLHISKHVWKQTSLILSQTELNSFAVM